LTGVNFIAMAAITAATIALELAAGKIDADIEKMTKIYLEDLKRSKWLFHSTVVVLVRRSLKVLCFYQGFTRVVNYLLFCTLKLKLCRFSLISARNS
jgi:hypothetical protein